jgi:hypothetical protein
VRSVQRPSTEPAAHPERTRTHAHARARTHTHARTHAHARARTLTHARTSMHAHVCTHAHAHARARTHLDQEKIEEVEGVPVGPVAVHLGRAGARRSQRLSRLAARGQPPGLLLVLRLALALALFLSLPLSPTRSHVCSLYVTPETRGASPQRLCERGRTGRGRVESGSE